jgi:hypothetical protein
MASISITRATGYYYGALASVAIEVNGNKVAGLHINDTHTMAVKPGPTTLSATMFGSPGRFDYRFNAERGKSYRFVVSPRSEAVTASMVGAAVLGGMGALMASAAEGNGPFKIEPATE